MKVRRLSVRGFRNLSGEDFCPCDGVNVLCGENAQGKTNLLEALWLFTGGRSFRGAKDSELVAFGQERAELTLDFAAAGREQQAVIALSPRRSASLNGVALGRASRLAGRFCSIVFSPAHLSLIQDGPESRRRFLDAAYCQLRPGYAGALSAYQRTLTQRNALLRDRAGAERRETAALLEVFDDRLAVAGARLTRVRGAYLEHIAPRAGKIYDGLSGGQERLALLYRPSGALPWREPEAQIRQALREALAAARETDMVAGFSTVGPHRDDFEVTVNELSARTFGSQGQRRSAVLALKLAEAAALEEVTGEPPVALLDDVMSELDERRQDYLLNHMTGGQVFITCCEPSAVLRLAGGGRFQVKNGQITPV